MDVNQVKFGNYAIGSAGSGAKKSEGKEKEEVKQEASQQETAQAFNADDMFDAMNVQGLQNKAQINFVAKKDIDPVQFLGSERVADIEAMMAQFETGVNNVKNVIENEFPNAFSEASKNALAAEIYAKV